jgi:hypothetical protein
MSPHPGHPIRHGFVGRQANAIPTRMELEVAFVDQYNYVDF